MTDLHSHLLPGIDDGSRNVEMSLAMLDMWREQGFERLCATPHFYADRDDPEAFFPRRSGAYEELTAAVSARGPSMRILLGAEVHFFHGIGRMEQLDRFCLEGTRLLLLEMPFTRWTDRMLDDVAHISRRGIVPVAAHLERYMAFNSAAMIRRFMAMDVMVQCNAEFFLTRNTSRKALRMLSEGLIHFLGSDAHNTDTRRPNLGPALSLIEKKLGAGMLDWLEENERLFLPQDSEALI